MDTSDLLELGTFLAVAILGQLSYQLPCSTSCSGRAS
jgi:hypothetical protein